MASPLALADQLLSICPLIAVSSTAQADSLCARGGFRDFSDLLRPLCAELRDAAVTVQTVNEPYTLRGLRVRVVPAAQMRPMAPEAAEKALLRVVTAHDSEAVWRCSPSGLAEHESTAPPETLARIRGLAEPTPWYESFRAQAAEALRFEPTSTLDQPVLTLLVAVAGEAAIVGALRALAAAPLPNALPMPADAPVPLFVVVLDDRSADGGGGGGGDDGGGAPSAAAAAALREVQTAFGAERVAILPMHSALAPSPLVDARLWAGAGGGAPAGAAAGAQAGARVSPADLEAARRLVGALVREHALPGLQRRVRALHGSVEKSRKGLKNTLKLWAGWGGGGGGGGGAADKRASLGVEGGGEKGGEGAASSAGMSTGGSSSSLSTLGSGFGFLASSAASMAAAASGGGSAAASLALGGGGGSSAALAALSGGGGGGGGAAREPAPADASAPARFGGESIEWQMQALADGCLLLQDFRTAHETYALLVTDYKAAKSAQAHHAGALLMRALTAALSEAPRRELEGALDGAYAHALKAGSAARATRAALLQLELSKRLPRAARAREAAATLMRCSTEVPNLQAALLLEQAALCHLRAQPPCARKAAFSLVLAGYRYVQAGLRAHASRCYAGALSQYAGKRWLHVEDHIRIFLARQADALGRPRAAVGSLACVLAASAHQGVERQASLLREFGAALLKAAAAADGAPVELGAGAPPLPRVAEPSVGVLTPELGAARRGGAPDALARGAAEWPRIKAAFADAARAAAPGGRRPAQPASSNWLTRALAAADAAASGGGGGAAAVEAPVAAVVLGEPVLLEVELENPLRVPLDLADLALDCSLVRADDDDLERADAAAGAGPPPLGAPSPPPPPPPQLAQFEVSAQSLRLAPRERAYVQLRVTPLALGVVSVNGLRWSLLGARATHAFGARALLAARASVAPPPLAAAARAGGGVAGAATAAAAAAARAAAGARCLQFAVRAAQPLLRLAVARAPAALLVGEDATLSLELHNEGTVPVERASLCASLPALVSLELAPGASAEAALGQAAALVLPVALDAPIAPGASAHVRVRVRVPALPGGAERFALHLAVEYAAAAAADGDALRRLAVTTVPLSVAPSLGCALAFARARHGHAAGDHDGDGGEMLAAVRVRSMAAAGSGASVLRLCHVACASDDGWSVVGLLGLDASTRGPEPGLPFLPGEERTLMLRLARRAPGGGGGEGENVGALSAAAFAPLSSDGAAALAAAAAAAKGATARAVTLSQHSFAQPPLERSVQATKTAQLQFWRERISPLLPSLEAASGSGTSRTAQADAARATAGTHFTFVYACDGGAAVRYGSVSMFDIALAADASASMPPAPPPPLSTRAGRPPQAPSKPPPPPPGPLGVAHWISAPITVRHAFGRTAAGAASPCLLDFSVVVQNLSCEVDLRVHVRTGPPASLAREDEPNPTAGGAPSPPGLLHAPSHGHIEWVGRVRSAPVLLPANGSAEVPLHALVHTPGRFDLGGYSIAVEVVPREQQADALARAASTPPQLTLVFDRGRAHVLHVVESQ